jgi:chemotaxis protein CheD
VNGERNVRVADLMRAVAMGRSPRSALGCVAIALWDSRRGQEGWRMCFCPPPAAGRLLCGPLRPDRGPGFEAVLELGAARATITARVVGGASMFTNLIAPGLIHTGERNVLAAREALHTRGVPVIGEWVGGDFGRTVIFDLATGKVTARSVRHGTREL